MSTFGASAAAPMFLTNVYAPTIICMQYRICRKITNENWEYYKVNDNGIYLLFIIWRSGCESTEFDGDTSWHEINFNMQLFPSSGHTTLFERCILVKKGQQRKIDVVSTWLKNVEWTSINQRFFHAESTFIVWAQRCFDDVKLTSIQFAFSAVFQRLTHVEGRLRQRRFNVQSTSFLSAGFSLTPRKTVCFVDPPFLYEKKTRGRGSKHTVLLTFHWGACPASSAHVHNRRLPDRDINQIWRILQFFWIESPI